MAGGYLALEPSPHAPLRLFCFHHAGAGALSFARWQKRFSADVSIVPVRLPGRESRLREARITDREQLLEALDVHLGPLLDRPHAFYGHSMGALVAYSFAAHRAEWGLRPPELVVAAACSAPDRPMPVLERADLSDLELVRVLSGADGISPYLLERPGWLQLMTATLRDDLRLARSLRLGARLPLESPLLAMAGDRDTLVPAEAVRAWGAWTNGGFRDLTVDGDHFFVRDPVAPLLVEAALDSLARLAPTR